MNSGTLEREPQKEDTRYFWGNISEEQSDTYFLLARSLKEMGMVSFHRPWQRHKEGILPVHATYLGLKIIWAVTSSPEFAVTTQLARYQGSPPDLVEKMLGSTFWDETFRARVLKTMNLGRARYLEELIEARDKGKSWLKSDHREELISEANRARVQAEELSQSNTIQVEEIPVIIDALIAKRISEDS